MSEPTDPIAREHELKTWPEYYERLLDGTKTFEYRRNDRGGFKVSDVLWLREYSSLTGLYSGREMRRRVTYVLPTDISGDYVVLALEPELRAQRTEGRPPETPQEDLMDSLHAVFTQHGIASRADLPHALISDLVGWAARKCREAKK